MVYVTVDVDEREVLEDLSVDDLAEILVDRLQHSRLSPKIHQFMANFLHTTANDEYDDRCYDPIFLPLAHDALQRNNPAEALCIFERALFPSEAATTTASLRNHMTGAAQ